MDRKKTLVSGVFCHPRAVMLAVLRQAYSPSHRATRFIWLMMWPINLDPRVGMSLFLSLRISPFPARFVSIRSCYYLITAQLCNKPALSSFSLQLFSVLLNQGWRNGLSVDPTDKGLRTSLGLDHCP